MVVKNKYCVLICKLKWSVANTSNAIVINKPFPAFCRPVSICDPVTCSPLANRFSEKHVMIILVTDIMSVPSLKYMHIHILKVISLNTSNYPRMCIYPDVLTHIKIPKSSLLKILLLLEILQDEHSMHKLYILLIPPRPLPFKTIEYQLKLQKVPLLNISCFFMSSQVK